MFRDFKNPLIYEEKDLDIASVAKGMPTLSSYSLQMFSNNAIAIVSCSPYKKRILYCCSRLILAIE